jgi:hypothetical protein
MTHARLDFMNLGADQTRFDAATLTAIASLAAIADCQRDVTAWLKQQDAIALSATRRDAASTNAGVNLQRDLEFSWGEVEREAYPPNSALELFFIDSSIPEGYEYASIERVKRSGEVQEIVGSEAVQISATVKVSLQREQFPVRHYATSTKYSIFQEMADGVRRGGFRQVTEELLAAREILAEHLNYRTWFGNPQSGQYGVLNYSWIPKYVISTPFTDASSWDELKDALARFIGRPFVESKGTTRPDTLVVSPRVYELLFRKTKTMGTSEISVGAWFIGSSGLNNGQPNNSAGIKQILFAHELTGAGPGGTDAMIAYRRDRRSIANNVINPFGRVPLQLIGLTYYNFLYMSHGGVIMRDVMSNVIGYVTPPSSF